jgi:hypothetical protein
MFPYGRGPIARIGHFQMASNEPVMAGSKTRHFKYTTNETGVTIAHVDGSNTRTFAIGDLPPEMIARTGHCGQGHRPKRNLCETTVWRLDRTRAERSERSHPRSGRIRRNGGQGIQQVG